LKLLTTLKREPIFHLQNMEDQLDLNQCSKSNSRENKKMNMTRKRATTMERKTKITAKPTTTKMESVSKMADK
jgi:hypothetical protein